MKNKKGVIPSEVIWIIVGVAFLVIAIAGIAIAKAGGFSQIGTLLERLRFGR